MFAYNSLATCPNETTKILAEELKSYGVSETWEQYGAVYFIADTELFYKLHYQISTAGRLFRVLKLVPAGTAQILFDKARRIPWHTYIRPNEPLRIDAVCQEGKQSKISASDVGSKIREAINDQIKYKLGIEPNRSSRNAIVGVTGFLKKNRCLISLETSGINLHKRGYRDTEHPAPIKETLAATILKLLEYDGNQVFYDPMCGSGTVAIEAAMIAVKKSVQIHRAKGKFALEHLNNFDKALWKEVQEMLRKGQLKEPPHALYASDLDEGFIADAKKSALNARVERYVSFSVGDFFEKPAPSPSGTLFANLPYDVRLSQQKMQEFYQRLKNHLDKNYQNWKAGLLFADETPWRQVGFKLKKTYALRNGSIPVTLGIITP